MPSHLLTNIAVIDDDRRSVEPWVDALENSRAWEDNPLDACDSRIILQPTLHVIDAQPEDSVDSFLANVRKRIFGEGFDAAASDPGFIPSSVFLVDWKFELNWLGDGSEERPSGVSFCREIRKYIPHALCILITSHESYTLSEADSDAFDFSIEKGRLRSPQGLGTIIKVIAQHLQQHTFSPTWAGLLQYSKMDKEILHALGTADGRNRSVTTQGFIDRFGANLFSSEASLTLEPLDSLLSPANDGCIRESQDLFADAFGSRRARFGTNGTTGTNSTVWAALFNEGDVVLVDKNCHISHHYSAARQGVTPLYVDPDLYVEPDVFGPVSLQSVLSKIHSAKDAGHLERIRGIVLTNCTFDGLFLDSRTYVEEIDKVIRSLSGEKHANEFIYFFDEAWFSFARFDPQLIRSTAMFAARHAKTGSELGPRVYATQSIHKTLSALRQASVVLEYDRFPAGPSGESGLDTPRFQQSFLAHTTTSPSAPIVASFDIARRQMLLEGAELIRGSADAAKTFAEALENDAWSSVGGKLMTSPKDARRVRSIPALRKDPTKLTLFHQVGLKGASAKKRLWRNGRVQINKYGVDSLMLMFMPGVTRSRNANLLAKLKVALDDLNVVENTGISNATHKVMIEKCIDESLSVRRYPFELLSHGRWGMREILYANSSIEVRMLGVDEILEEKSYIVCSFVTPYPPGHPALLPGQVVSGDQIRALLSADGEVHGRDAEGRIAVAEVASPD